MNRHDVLALLLAAQSGFNAPSLTGSPPLGHFPSLSRLSRAYHPHLGRTFLRNTHADIRRCPIHPVTAPLCPPTSNLPTVILHSTNKLFPPILMPHSQFTAASSSSSSSNFQLMINDALDTYKSRTKKDLRDHPLADQLQTLDSPSAILAVLQQQAQQTEQSRSTDGRCTKWLDPTVKVLHFFVKVLGAAGGPVCLRICTSLEICSLIFMWQVLPSSNLIFAGIGELLSVCILINFARAIVTHIRLSGN
jgi:hypothetical protein